MWVEILDFQVILHSARPDGDAGERCFYVNQIPVGEGRFIYENGNIVLAKSDKIENKLSNLINEQISLI